MTFRLWRCFTSNMPMAPKQLKHRIRITGLGETAATTASNVSTTTGLNPLIAILNSDYTQAANAE